MGEVIDFQAALNRIRVVDIERRPAAPSPWDGSHMAIRCASGGVWQAPHVVMAAAVDPWHDEQHGAMCRGCEGMSGCVVADGGRVGPCPACEPIRSMLRRVRAAGIPWEWGVVERYNDPRRVPVGALEASADTGRLWWGAPGCGKSHLAALLAWRFLHAGQRVLWLPWPTVLERWRARVARGDEDVPPWGVVGKGGLVVLDDLGVDRATEWVQARVYQALEELHPEAVLAVTSNLPPRELAVWCGARAWRRLERRVEVMEVEG